MNPVPPPQSGMVPQQPQTQQAPMMMVTGNNKRPKYASKTVFTLGLIQVIGGILTFVFFIPLAGLGSITAYSGAGVWVSILWILGGAFGIASSKTKTVCMIRTYMVLSIIGAVFMTVIFGVTAAALAVDRNSVFYYYRDYIYHDYNYPDYHNKWNATFTTTTTTTTTTTYPPFLKTEQGKKYIAATILNSLTLIIAFVELVTFIWGAALTCKVGCCCNGNQPGVAIPVQYINGQPCVIIGQNQQIIAPVGMAGGSGMCPESQPMVFTTPPNYQASALEEKRAPVPDSPPPSYG